MKILLVGYGKMGKTIERLVLERGHEISGKIDIANQDDWTDAHADVAIEFSHPDAAFENIKRCLEKKIPVVSGTTGWLARKGEIEQITAKLDGAFFYASNYSLGVNIFFKINEQLAKMIDSFPSYRVHIDEIHHSEKKDAPSGTAITLAEGIIRHLAHKKSWVNTPDGKEDEVPIQSFRIDEVPGTHVVKYSSPIDDIEIKHTAHTREGFALGAVMVAEWIRNRRGVLNMSDFLKF
jgi:4-hydroxy-tetrahydrodipicolinate reductase